MRIFRFNPILKQIIWGGDKIAQMKHLDAAPDSIGESWELSGVPGNESICPDEGGKSLNQLVTLYRERLVGHHVYERFGDSFPLLVKFIDARQNLSIQVHPDDEMAHRQGKACGKTEMWYLLPSAPDAFLYSGLQKMISREQYQQMLADDTITDALARYSVKADDVFFLPAGRIHAIGAGCLLAEIQQTSDVTYRIYDYGRRDKDGNLRQLHTREALEAINFDVQSDYRTHYIPQRNCGVELVSCPYFTTTVYDINSPVCIGQKVLDSFIILMGIDGCLTVSNDEDTATLQACQTLLLPADNDTLRIEGTGKFLEIHV